MKYLRTSVRGIEKVTTEAGIAIMAANLLKLTLKVNVIFRKSIVKKIIVVFRFNISLKTTIILFCVAYVPASNIPPQILADRLSNKGPNQFFLFIKIPPHEILFLLKIISGCNPLINGLLERRIHIKVHKS
ncbi:hypothetical protein ACNAN0_00030 [Agrilactobacillus fermenti]|uniref:hypothetical protein n=1 Tax=Agrilactobacillus fermenti TaxID=2586909 RepID=UPI003A5BF110